MRTALLIAAVLTAAPAWAQAASAPRRSLLAGSEGVDPVRDTRGSMFLAGLGLTGAGLLLGGAGFGILYACREGQTCHADKTLNTVGWVLAAPGVIPLAVGLILIYASTGGKGTHGASSIAMGFSPLPQGGAIASAAFRF